ncbi:MAG: mechanosensitive ion channel [Chloroflexi bacterium]|nr:mechanosensitive ion channel [Chloroflexota bacterium]
MNEATLTAAGDWLATHGLRIVLIVAGAWLLLQLIDRSVDRASRTIESRATRLERDQRERVVTMAGVFHSLAAVAVFAVAALMILSELAIDIAPLIAGAGLLGLAIGFGAQTLVKDLLGGLFILLEDQFNVGDGVRVGGVSGAVERITLRATYLRDADGTRHLVPNGEIRVVSNSTVGWSRAIIDVRVGYDQDTGRVMHALAQVVAETNADPELQQHMLEPLVLNGLEALDVDTMRLRIMGKTKTGEQDAVNRAVRQRIVERFAAEQIGLPMFGRATRDGGI